jgi:radical SAM superfamily enzyme YgiQ (UPF0313 family)
VKKLLFITALNTEWELDLRQSPLGIGYLAAMIERERPGRYQILHIANNVAETLDRERPDLVAISSTSPYFGVARQYAQAAAARKIPVIVGGIHVSMLPQSLYPEMAVAVLGEGERTIVTLLDLFEETGGFPRDRLRDIPGLAFRDANGLLVQTPPVEYIDPLDQIPHPDRSLGEVRRHAYLFTSRGCPYRCSFCASTRFWPGKVRFFSAAYVVDEIQELVEKHQVTLISFYDDLFCANLPRLKKIAELVRQRGLLGRLRFTCNARANIVTDELAATLKGMNVASVNMGLESGCETTLSFLKDRVTVRDNQQAMATLHRHGLFVSGSFIIGSPEETEEQMMETYQLLKKSPLAITDVNILMPFPGTPIWEYAVERGLVANDMDWNRLTHGDVINPRTIINLSQRVTTERLCLIYRQFMRLRYRKILSSILWHPYRMDILRTALRAAAATCTGGLGKAWRGLFGGGVYSGGGAPRD